MRCVQRRPEDEAKFIVIIVIIIIIIMIGEGVFLSNPKH